MGNTYRYLLLSSMVTVGWSQTTPAGQTPVAEWLAKPRLQVELAPDFYYDSGPIAPFVTFHTSFQSVFARINYFPSAKTMFSLAAPYIHREDVIKFPGQSLTFTGSGIGDVQAAVERTQRVSSLSPWELVFGGRVQAPTGKNVYRVQGAASPLGTGHWEGGGLFGIRRVSDPVFFTASVEVDEEIPRTIKKKRISPGLGGSAQTAIGYAMSDHWVFMEQFSFMRRPNVLLITPTNPTVRLIDQDYLTHSFIYHPTREYAMHFRFVVGLRKASSYVGVGLLFQWNAGSIH